MKTAFFWSVQWSDLSSGNHINSDGGPYRALHNAESARDRCIEQISRKGHRLDNHYCAPCEVPISTVMIEDVPSGEYVPKFEIAKTNIELNTR